MSRRAFHRASEADRRRDLIAATLDCIAESGLENATVREIAARAGVTQGLIRHYFVSKDQMLHAAYRDLMAGLIGGVMEAAEGVHPTARGRLRAFIVANLSTPVADAKRLSLWAAFISRVRVDPVFAQIHLESYTAFRAVLEDLVTDVLKEAERDPDPAVCRELAIAINGLIDGLWLEGTLAGELFADTPISDIAIRSVEALLGGVSLDANTSPPIRKT